jgi:hypothetical protein
MNQKQKVLKYINDYGSITSWEAYSDLGIMQLGARIDGLQKDGYSFKKEWEQRKNRYGEPVRFIKYSLLEVVNEQ